MPWTGPATTLTLIAATIISWFHAWYVWRNRTAQPASAFIGLMILTGFWTLSSALVVLSGPRPEAHVWYRLMGAFVPYTAVGVFITCAQYVDYAPVSRRPIIGLLLAVPTISAILDLTGDSHTLYTYNVEFHLHDQYIISFSSTTGPWFVVHAVYSYVLVTIGMLMLIQRMGSTRFTPYRWQAALMLLGFSFPFVASLVNTFLLAEATFLPQFVVIVSTPLAFWALFRYRLFSLHPIARDQAFEDMDDAVLVIDTNNRLIDINPAAERFIGQPAVSVVGLPIADAFANSLPNLDQRLDRDQTQIEIGSGDQQRSFDLRITPLNRNHTPIGKLIVIRDSTEQKRAEREARRHEIDQERVRTLSEFVTNASHEFRNPLSIIKTSTYLLSRKGALGASEAYVTQINNQANRIAALVDDLLAVVRLERQAALELAPADVNAIVCSIAGRVNEAAAAKDLQIKLDLADNLLPVSSAPESLGGALFEIIDNAIRFTPQGGCINLSTAQEEENIVIRVADTGIGIAPEHLPHIFDVFYRVDEAHTIAGFGVGLAIAKRITHLHGGNVQVTSALGVGTTVHISLPAAPAQGC